MSPFAILIPEDTELIDAARQVADAGMHLICNGRRTVLSRIVPPGWFKVAVNVNTQQASPCQHPINAS